MLVVIAQLMILLLGGLGWIAVMFAALPGSHTSRSWHARLIRGLFYIYPLIVLLAWYQSGQTLPENIWGLLWCLLPVMPVALVWLIFKIHEGIKRR